jgi:uncharacterized protein
MHDPHSPEPVSEAVPPAVASAETAAPAIAEPLTPVTGGERVEIIDIVRGLALFGILAANIRGFAAPAVVYFQPDLYWTGLGDRLAQAFIDTFIQGKFITIFAFLFGVGFAVQLSRAEARGVRLGWTYARRLLLLIGFGLIHGLLIWFGDILLVYGLIGFTLLFFRKRRNGTLVTWAVLGMLVPLLIVGLIVGAMAAGVEIPMPPKPTAEELEAETAVFSSGSWSAIQAQRVTDAITLNWGMLPFFGTHVMGIFLLGMLAWRKRFFQPAPESLPRYRRTMLWGLSLGVAGNLAATLIRWVYGIGPMDLSPPLFMVMLIQAVSVPLLSLGYVCAVILVSHSHVWRPRLSRFGAVGRTALSNYLLQAVIGTLIFYSYGLGLFGTMGPALLILPTLAIFALQVIVSSWWLECFRFGPAEWLWRTLTYGKMQPFLRRPKAPLPPRQSAAV